MSWNPGTVSLRFLEVTAPRALVRYLEESGGMLPGADRIPNGEESSASRLTRSCRTRSLRRPAGVLRLIFRVPTCLYRLRLGWLLGHRFLLLTHQGRKSGHIYRTVLEVVRYDPHTGQSVVVPAWGARADWYRNLCAAPAIEVQIGRERYAPVQRFLSPEETYSEIADYERRHPWFSRILAYLLGRPLDGTEASRRALAVSVRLVAFRPPREPKSRDEGGE